MEWLEQRAMATAKRQDRMRLLRHVDSLIVAVMIGGAVAMAWLYVRVLIGAWALASEGIGYAASAL